MHFVLDLSLHGILAKGGSCVADGEIDKMSFVSGELQKNSFGPKSYLLKGEAKTFNVVTNEDGEIIYQWKEQGSSSELVEETVDFMIDKLKELFSLTEGVEMPHPPTSA